MGLEVIIVLSILVVTVVLLILETFRIDIVALIAMLALAWTGILTPVEALSGFSSNAVISMIAVMIMGSGIAGTGAMNAFAEMILKFTGKSRKKINASLSGAVGLISAFMQNVGAVALLLPAVKNISKKQNIPVRELIMPLGFAAITGGTLTMIASGPLIILNDILRTAGLEPYGLFSVTPIGLILLLTVILYFLFFGKQILYSKRKTGSKESEQQKLINSWNLPDRIFRYTIPKKSPLSGQTPESSGVWNEYSIHVLAVSKKDSIIHAPWRNTLFEEGQDILLLGEKEDIFRFAGDKDLVLKEKLEDFKNLKDPKSAGFAEVVIPPRSSFIGKSLRDISFRKNYSVEPILVFSGDEKVSGDSSDRKFKSGDTVVIHGLWEKLLRIKEDSGLVVITPFKPERYNVKKAWISILCFLGAVILTMTHFPISISLFSGAVAMIVLKVINIEDVYRSIDWKVVFLIAGLIPLGTAMQTSGTAEFLADKIMGAVGEGSITVLIVVIAILSTLFSLFMSNVASTVVLAPLVISMAAITGIDPAPLVLLVAVCSANSFILPTHQVNAMLMTPGGYTNRDYFKAGGILTVIFLAVVTVIFRYFYI